MSRNPVRMQLICTKLMAAHLKIQDTGPSGAAFCRGMQASKAMAIPQVVVRKGL